MRLPATSAVLGRALRRLSDDYLAVHGHRVLAVEAFTDPARHTGACYAAANFAQVGEALGYGRCAAALPILSAPFDRPLLTREEASCDRRERAAAVRRRRASLPKALEQVTDPGARRGIPYSIASSWQ